MDITTIWLFSNLEELIDLDQKQDKNIMEGIKHDRTDAFKISDGTPRSSTNHA